MYNGNDLIEMGLRPCKEFDNWIKAANNMHTKKGFSYDEIKDILLQRQPLLEGMRDTPASFTDYLVDTNELEWLNKQKVEEAFREVMKQPKVMGGAIMPDGCPAGEAPVGSVIAVNNALVPSYHSADVCCSVALTELLEDISPSALLDDIQKYSHWGGIPMDEEKRFIEIEEEFLGRLSNNPFTRDLHRKAARDFGSQGDGNHFYYVGHRQSTGRLCIVSHHGSRGFGAEVYRRGLRAAKKYCNGRTSYDPRGHAWLDFDTDEGRDYWEALQLVREWTKRNHFDFHDAIINMHDAHIADSFWNPHNFIFKKGSTFYHAKGATPNYAGHSHDDSGLTLVPLNMEEPILILSHTDNPNTYGFAPHGAGRNMSRTQFLRENPEPRKPLVDYRFWAGRADASELPDAYKSAEKVRNEIKEFDIGEVVDQINPYGCVMAGDTDYDAPWRVKKREKEAKRNHKEVGLKKDQGDSDG